MKIRVDRIPEEGRQIEGNIDPASVELDIPCYSLDEPLALKGRAARTGEDVYVEGTLTGSLNSECSRCLVNFRMPLDLDLNIVFAPQKEGMEEDNDALEQDENLSYYSGDSIDLVQEIKDLILVTLPIKPICRPDCKGLCPQCGADLNTNPCRCEQHKGPSPFDKLKELKGKLE